METNDADTKNSDFIKEEKFWKQCDRINEETFKLEADSGDILLFKGRSFSAKMTRRLTNSEYDHVGMVLTFIDDEEVYILEATSDGVHIIRWSELMSFKESSYSKIVWRKLYWNRDNTFWEILQTFVEAVENK